MTVISRLLAVVLLFTALALSAWSYPTMFGDTGLVLVPSADTMPYTFYQLGIDYSKIMDPAGDALIYPVRLDYGVAENIEVFAVAAESHGGALTGANAMGVGFKFALYREQLNQVAPGLAFGVRAVSFNRPVDDLDQIEAYLVASKVLFARGNCVDDGFFIRAHGGVAYTNFTGAHEETIVSGFGGISYANANGSSLAVDYVPSLESDTATIREATISGAVRIHLSPSFWMQLGTTRPLGLGSDQSYTLGLMYQYGDRLVMPTGRQIFYY